MVNSHGDYVIKGVIVVLLVVEILVNAGDNASM